MDYESIFTQCNTLKEKDLFKGPSPIHKTPKCKVCGVDGEHAKLSPCGNKEYICQKCKAAQETASAGSNGKVYTSRAKKISESVFDMDPDKLAQDSDLSELIEAADALLQRVDAGSYTVVDDHLEFTIDTDFTKTVEEDPETYLKNYFEKFMNIPVVVNTVADEEGFSTCEVRPA